MTALTMRRNAILSQIRVNPFSLILRRPDADTSPSGQPRRGGTYSSVSTQRDARVAFKKTSVPLAGTDTPQLTEDAWFLLVDYRTTIQKDDQFSDGEGRAWEIMEVTALSKFGGIIGYEGALRRLDATA